MLNERDEKYLALNFERIRYWLGEGADLSTPVAELLGKCKMHSGRKWSKAASIEGN